MTENRPDTPTPKGSNSERRNFLSISFLPKISFEAKKYTLRSLLRDRTFLFLKQERKVAGSLHISSIAHGKGE